ncbi:hypothetical protein BVI2075_1100038 [Burkholderia vietnamiensis]|nr:hypothetical protein BVI2075_1100038 [Burkholderia vietnamiensis]
MSSRNASSSGAFEGMAGGEPKGVEMPGKTPPGTAYSISIRKIVSWNKATRAASYSRSTMIRRSGVHP